MKQAMERVMQAYKSGDFAVALSLLDPQLSGAANPDPAHLALLGNIQFKLGNRLAAAEAFAASGKGGGDNAAMLLRLAGRLFVEERRLDRLAAFGAAIIAANPREPDFALQVGEAMLTEGRVSEMEPLLASLDRSDMRHLALITNCHRLSGRHERLAAELDAALAGDPGNVMLTAIRSVVAREIFDVAFMERYEKTMADLETPLASALLACEGALARLYWNDDEAVDARECQESAALRPSLEAGLRRGRRPISPAGGKLRIGYLSNDFYSHATMTLFFDVMQRHDFERFDIVLLCYTEPFCAAEQQGWPETLRERIVSLYGKTDDEAAQLIDELGIDVLVDLKGHTMKARLQILNLARAPLKVTYLGHPGTVVGADLDYVISDRIVTPDSSKPFYHERLCRLPDSYQANTCESRAAPRVTDRAAHGLPEHAFVFASFNAPFKFTPARLRLWARMLNAVPGSVLWCMCTIPLAARNLIDFLEAEGVDRSRVVIASTAAYADHLGRVRLADLVLDTAPYNGHTTTSDMLWAGVPVLALRGKSFASRVSASLLTAVGLPELIAETEDEAVAMAVALAGEPARLAALRARIDAARFLAPLFDTERFARHLERAYEMMAERLRAGLRPDHIDVPALPPRLAPFSERPGFGGA